MPSLLFDKCCICIELKTGCFIIGYFNLVLSLIFSILLALAVVGGVVISNDTEHANAHEVGLFVVIASAVLLFFFILFMAFVIVLLVGLHKNKPGHVKAYLIYAVIFLVITAIDFISNLANGATAGSIAQSLITILVNLYFILVIRSYYYKMKDPSRGPAIYNAA